MRKLKIEEIDFRVGMVKKGAKGVFATLLAYKDARVDMNVLDETFGCERWQNEYKRDSNGVLQCGIGVLFTVGTQLKDLAHLPNNEWVWKWSNGVPSEHESDKGEYSDAFKRAGFMWGIGRELYDMPTLFVELKEGEYFEQNGKVKASPRFRPNMFKWSWTDTEIKAIDSSGEVRCHAKR